MWYLKLILYYSPPIAPAIIGAGISAAGSLLGGIIGGGGADNGDARKMMAYQKYMNDNAILSSYPLTMQSMKNAGLNPMLAFQKGADAPSVSSQTPINNKAQLGQAITNASQVAATVENTKANTAKQVADTQKAQADTALSSAQAIETAERTKTYPQNIKESDVRINNLLSQTALSSVTYNKVLQEVDNLKLIPNLTQAQTNESLSRAGLTSAQITEIAPRIRKLIAETEYTNASIGKAEILGLPGNMLKQLLTNSAQDNGTAGSKIVDSVKSNAKYLNSPNYRRNHND